MDKSGPVRIVCAQSIAHTFLSRIRTYHVQFARVLVTCVSVPDSPEHNVLSKALQSARERIYESCAGCEKADTEPSASRPCQCLLQRLV